jgi:glutamine synthetase
MVKKQYLPAGLEYSTFLADSIGSFNAISVPAPVQEDLLKKLNTLLAASYKNLAKLEGAVEKTQAIDDTVKKAESCRDKVVNAMQELRKNIDAMEMAVPQDMWPVPSYADLLFKL